MEDVKEEKVKIGDMLWVKLKGPTSDFGYGEVIGLFETPSGDSCFEFHCRVNGGYRIGLEKNIINKPNVRMMSKMANAQKELSEVLKKKWSVKRVKQK